MNGVVLLQGTGQCCLDFLFDFLDIIAECKKVTQLLFDLQKFNFYGFEL